MFCNLKHASKKTKSGQKTERCHNINNKAVLPYPVDKQWFIE